MLQAVYGRAHQRLEIEIIIIINLFEHIPPKIKSPYPYKVGYEASKEKQSLHLGSL
jgi:hypothetical protein